MRTHDSKMRRRRQWSFTLVLASALLALPALAGEPTGTGHVKAVDLAARTVTLRGSVYRVTHDTRMVDASGRGTQLERLRPVPDGASSFGDDEADAVWWSAVATPGGWVLTELKVLKAMPD